MARVSTPTKFPEGSPPGQEVLAPSGGQLTTGAYDDLEEMNPQDSEVSRDDVAVPRIKLLQDLSPHTKKTKAEFIDGAKPNMFFNTATEELWSADPGILVISCAFLNSYIEWRPRDTGEGMVADRTDEEGVREVFRAALAKRKENNKKIVLPNGNEIAHSADHYVLLTSASTPEGPWQEAVLGLSGSQTKKSRRWLALIESRTLTKGSPPRAFRPLPCAFAYKVTTKEESNNDGTWWGYVIQPWSPPGSTGANVPITVAPWGKFVYERAVSFRKLVLEGKRRAAVEVPLSPEEDPAEKYDPDEGNEDKSYKKQEGDAF